MTRWVKKNAGWRVLSISIAVALWMSVASEPEMATLISVPIQYKEPGGDLEVSSLLIETVQLETHGLSGRLRDLAAARTAVVLDFSTVTEPGERTFTVARAQTNLPRGVELLRATPAQLRFVFERRERRWVPVVVRVSGTLPAGITLAGMEAVPATKEIVGPASKVRRVDSVSTDPVNLAGLGLANPGRETIAYITEPQVRFVAGPRVTVKMVLK
jgi:hypothetical protein